MSNGSGGGGNSSGGSGGGGGSGNRRRPAKGRSGAGQSQGSNRASSGGRSSSNRRRTASADADFWGKAPEAAPPVIKIRPSADPSALPRSLGDPPIGPSPAAAAHHLTVIYEEAVRAGTALAAASGLLEDEDSPPLNPSEGDRSLQPRPG